MSFPGQAPPGLGFTWRELAEQWLAAQGDDAKLQHFTNERLGRPWADKRTTIRTHSLIDRAEGYPLRTVPPGALILTAGIDTQDNRLVLTIVGWGAGAAWWLLDWEEIPGDPGDAEVWNLLTDRLNRPLVNAWGREVRVRVAAVDMAGHKTEAVKRYVTGALGGPHPRCVLMAMVGDNNKQVTILSRPHKTDAAPSGRTLRTGMQYFRVGTERAKDRLFADIRALAQDTDAEAAPRAHFSRALEPEYYEQLTAETWDPRRNRYVIKRGRRNEAIDCWVYAYAAANHPRANVPRLTPRQWAALAAQLEVAPAQGLAPPEDGEAGPAPADAAPAPAPPVPTSSPRPSQPHAPGAPQRPDAGTFHGPPSGRRIDRRFIR